MHLHAPAGSGQALVNAGLLQAAASSKQQHAGPAQQIRVTRTFNERGAGDTSSHNGAALQLSHAQRPELPCQPHGAPLQVAEAEVAAAKICLAKADLLQDQAVQAPVAADRWNISVKSSKPRATLCTIYRQLGQRHIYQP